MTDITGAFDATLGYLAQWCKEWKERCWEKACQLLFSLAVSLPLSPTKKIIFS